MNFLFVLQMMAFGYDILVLVVRLVAVLAFRKVWRIRPITPRGFCSASFARFSIWRNSDQARMRMLAAKVSP